MLAGRGVKWDFWTAPWDIHAIEMEGGQPRSCTAWIELVWLSRMHRQSEAELPITQ